MTHRERMLAVLECNTTDRVPVDLMEGIFFGEMRAHFKKKGYATEEEVLRYLDIDCRWLQCSTDPADMIRTKYDTNDIPETDFRTDKEFSTYSGLYERPLRECTTAAEVERLYHPDLSELKAPDLAKARKRWPDHALVLLPSWFPLLCGACDMFGMEEAMYAFYMYPEAIEAFLELRNHAYLKMLERVLTDCGEELDIVWIGDDYADQRSLMISPEMWRRFIKPRLRKQVDLIHRFGKKILLHSCGAVSELYPDWIDMGIHCHLVFQTTAQNMSVEKIANEYGGKIAFYGGVDVQQLLVSGTADMVRCEIKRNIAAFEHCGGYIVANSHHGLPDIRPDLIEVMALTVSKKMDSK